MTLIFVGFIYRSLRKKTFQFVWGNIYVIPSSKEICLFSLSVLRPGVCVGACVGGLVGGGEYIVLYQYILC